MILLLVAGVVVGAAGFLAVGFGIPIKDTTFGNTIQLAGITLLCTALLLVGLALVVRELKAVTRALGQGATRVAQRGQPGRGPQAIRPAMPPNPLAPVVEQPGAPLAAEPVGAEPQQPGAAAVPPPWAAEAAARERSRMAPAEDGPATVQPPDAAPPAPAAVPERPRRNLLFATRRR